MGRPLYSMIYNHEGELVLAQTIHAAWDESVFAIEYRTPRGRRVLMILLLPGDL